MYKRILVAIENSAADQTILAHVTELARLTGAELLLVHVADGFMARNQKRLGLDESDEMRDDRDYLARRADELATEGFKVNAILECGEPADHILAIADREQCDRQHDAKPA